MNVDDFNAWWAQIDMADNLKECARIEDALFVSGKKYEELPVAESMLVDHLYSRVDHLYSRGVKQRMREELEKAQIDLAVFGNAFIEVVGK